MIEITSQEQLSELITKNALVVVDFYAPWCHMCPAMATMLEGVEGDYPSIPFVKVNIDAFPELKEQFKIKAIPMVLFIRHGRTRDFMFGDYTVEKFQRKMRMQQEALARVQGTSIH